MRSNKKFTYSLGFTRFMALNPDQTRPTPSRIIGSSGPFDFSRITGTGAFTATLNVKIDSKAVEAITVKFPATVKREAVTMAEVIKALDSTTTGVVVGTNTPTDITASVEGDRIKFAYSGSGTPSTVQMYGLFAELVGLGQGRGLKFIKTTKFKDLGVSPIQQEGSTNETVPASTALTEVQEDGYRKGSTLTIVDSADDIELQALIDGGVISEDVNGVVRYDEPNSDTEKTYFFIQAFYKRFAEGSHKSSDQVGWRMDEYRSCTGSLGESSHGTGFSDTNFTITCTPYKDENGELFNDRYRLYYTNTQYEALKVYDV